MQSSVTQAEIARQLGVHQTTVSAILGGKQTHRYSEEIQRKVRETARRLGYRPSAVARSLRGARSGLIGLFHFGRDKDVELERLHELVVAIHDANYRPLAMPMATSVMWVEKDAGSACSSMLEAHVEALILSGFSDDFDLSQLKRFQAAKIPIVSVSGLKLPGIPHFSTDREDAVYESTMHLIQRGRTRLAYLGRRPSRLDQLASARATPGVDGFLRAMREAGLSEAQGFTRVAASPLVTGLDAFQSGEQMMREVLEADPRPDGVVCYDDAWAFGAYGHCLRNGVRIPKDVAIVGFENQRFCQHLVPRLSSVSIPNTDLARAAIRALTGLIESEDHVNTDQDRKFPGTLIPRESSE